MYTFRDSAKPIAEQLKQTSFQVILAICAASALYELVEGWITYAFARHYNPGFRYLDGVESAFYCSFYRVATLGSGAGIAAIYYFHEKEIDYSKSTGMYMIEYVIHKVSIAILSVLLLIFNFGFFKQNYSSYLWMLVLGYGITVVVACFLLLFCCSTRFHRLLLWLSEKVNRKLNGKIERQKAQLAEYCGILEEATRDLLRDGRLIFTAVLKNLLKFACWYSIPYLVLRAECDLTLFQGMAVMSLTAMLAAVIPSPAGIGSTEFVFTLLFSVLIGTDLRVHIPVISFCDIRISVSDRGGRGAEPSEEETHTKKQSKHICLKKGGCVFSCIKKREIRRTLVKDADLRYSSVGKNESILG